jgi:hypothetical protein
MIISARATSFFMNYFSRSDHFSKVTYLAKVNFAWLGGVDLVLTLVGLQHQASDYPETVDLGRENRKFQ